MQILAYGHALTPIKRPGISLIKWSPDGSISGGPARTEPTLNYVD